MKKTRLPVIIFLLLISGCSRSNEKIFLTFESCEKIVSDNINSSLNENKSISEYQNFYNQCEIKSDDDNIKLNSNIKSSGFLDKSKNEKIDIYPEIYFFDKKGKNEVSISGSILNFYRENQYFTKFSGFSIDMGKGNYESNLRYIIMENLGDKWIRFDSIKFNNVREGQKNIKFLLNTMSSSSVFENIGQVTYEGNIAYKISIKQDILSFLKDQTNIDITDFDGLFVIKSNDNVDLKINNMQVIYKNDLGTKNINIKGVIGKDDGILKFSRDGENIEISFEKYRKYTKLNISKSINFDQIWNITTNISQSKKENSNIFNIKGDIQISPMVIYGSDLENELKINIKCLYENFSGEVFEIKEPESYILLDQILGDEFSIKNFIGNK